MTRRLKVPAPPHVCEVWSPGNDRDICGRPAEFIFASMMGDTLFCRQHLVFYRSLKHGFIEALDERLNALL